MLSPCKRQNNEALPPAKRQALRSVTNQLTTPPTTPDKKSIVDLSEDIKSSRGVKRLSFEDSVYSRAKAVFQRGAQNKGSDHLVGREDEAACFSAFLKTSIGQKKCSSLYISGPPGTGKTAQVNLSLDNLGFQNKDVHSIHGSRVRVLRVNCMTVSKPENIFHEIFSFVTGQTYSRKKTFDDVYSYLCTAKDFDSLVVVLDEMDSLITKDQQVLFQLFHCASHLKSSVLSTKLVLIGISNALDLTDKFLPRLRSNGFNPEALQFMPYTGEQVKQVVISKLRSLVEFDKENSAPQIPIMHPTAIQLCCKKCAAVTGDLRKAFDICYKSIEFVEHQARKTTDVTELTFETAPKVLISHVASVCAATFGDNSLAKIKNLNLLQRAVLCCLFSLEKNSAKVLTVNGLFDYYSKHTVDVVDNLLGRLKKGEFLEIVSALESSSVIILSNASKTCTMDNGNKSIRPNVLYDDLVKTIGDIGVLRRILQASR